MPREIPIAEGRMAEFNPTAERHHPLLIIKAVEPGCTTEIQLELHTGEIRRLTTTDDWARDTEAFKDAVVAAFLDAWDAYEPR